MSVGIHAEKFNIRSNDNGRSRKKCDFMFQIGSTLFEQICSKNQNRQFKLKFGTSTNSNVQNSIMMFTFSVLGWEYLFRAYLVQKKQNCQFKLEFGTQTNSNIKNSMVMLIFSAFEFDGDVPRFFLDIRNTLWVNLVQDYFQYV